jgi:hypothetical protein
MPSKRISRILATSSGGRSSHVAMCFFVVVGWK